MSNLSVEEDNDIIDEIDNHILSIEQKINTTIKSNIIKPEEVKKKFSIGEKKEIVNKIKMLSKIEHIEIFKILKNNNIKYTENSNGIFINFINVSDDIIATLEKFINFCYKNKDSLVEKEIILNEKKNIIENKYYSSSSSNSDEEILSDHNDTKDSIDGSKIVLKKNKPTYTGIKAKIMKNYKVGVKTNK